MINESSKDKIVTLIAKYPHRKDEILADMQRRGIATEWVDDAMPLSLSAESEEFSKGIDEGLTFSDEGPIGSRAGTVDLPFLGKSSPSRMAGNVVGSLPLGIGAYMLAGAGAAAAGLTGAARTVATVVGGEALPGALQGYVSSDGDFNETMKHAAIWTSIGLLSEGVFGGLYKAYDKVKKGQPLDADDVSNLKSLDDAAEKAGGMYEEETLALPPSPDFYADPQGNIDTREGGVVYVGEKGMVPVEVETNRVGSGVDAQTDWSVDEQGRARRPTTPPPIDYPTLPPSAGDRVVEETKPLFSSLARGAHESIKPVVDTFVDILDKNLESANITAQRMAEIRAKVVTSYQHIAKQVMDGKIDPNEAVQILNKLFRSNKNVNNYNKANDPSSPQDVSRQSFRRLDSHYNESEYQGGPKRPNPNVNDPRRGGTAGGQFVDTNEGYIDNRLDIERQTLITEDQIDEIRNLERRIAEEGYQVPTLSDEQVSGLDVGRARQRIADLRNKLNVASDDAHNEALSNLLQKEVNPDVLRRKADFAVDAEGRATRSSNDIDVSKGIDPSKLSRIDLLNYKAYQESRPLKDFSNLKEVGPERVRVYVDRESPEKLFKMPGLPWFMKILSPTSRWGLSANPLSKVRVTDTLDTLERIGRDTAHYLDRMKKALKPLEGGSLRTNVSAMLGNRRARADQDRYVNMKRVLVRALDSDPATANKLLTEAAEDNPAIVKVYSDLRGILDELADMLKMEKNARVTQYFPHIFDGDSGSHRANRLMFELGPMARAKSGLKPSDGGKDQGLPYGKLFSSLFERTGEGAQDYSQELESVLYAYIRGAVDKRYMDPLIKRTKNTMDNLPQTDDAGRKLYNREELRNWFGYVLGEPTPWKEIQAHWWRNNETFNRMVDNLVTYLGDLEDKKLLTLARKGRLNEKGERVPYTKQEEDQAVSFFQKLIRDASSFEVNAQGETSVKRGNYKKRYKARLALMADDIRQSLADPARKPIILEKLYGLMVINKLGFSLSHGIINSTQAITNTFPLLGLKHTARGIKHYVEQRNPGATIGNRRIVDIIEESGVTSDFSEAKEFRPQGVGIFQVYDDIAMTPATVSEDFLRTSALLGQYEKSIVEEGLDHAHALAKARQLVRDTQFSYNRGATPPLFHGPFVRFLLMFKTYSIHQINFSAELLEDALKGNPEPFMKHMLGYVAMAGAGATFLGPDGLDTKFGDQSQHPAIGLMEGFGQRGVAETLGGPPSSALLELLDGQIGNAYDEFATPTIQRRIERAIEQGDPMIATGLR